MCRLVLAATRETVTNEFHEVSHRTHNSIPSNSFHSKNSKFVKCDNVTRLWLIYGLSSHENGRENFPNSFSVGLLTDWILRLRAVPLFHLMLLIQCQFMEFNFEFMRKNWKDSKQIYFASANFSIYLFCLLFLMKHGKMSQKCSVRKKDQKANQPNVWCPSITIRLIWQNKNHSCKLRWEKRALKRKNQLFFVFIFSFSAISGKKICWHY